MSKLRLLGTAIDNLDYADLLESISRHINDRTKLTVGYANSHILNILQKNPVLSVLVNSMDIIHPDGVGVYLASKILYGRNGFKSRFTGSDFYAFLQQKLIEKKWSVFFFGTDRRNLDKVFTSNPHLNIAGVQDGYVFDTENLISELNMLNPDIIFVGMGFPKQEQWIMRNKDRLDHKVIIAVGDGIRVFSKTKLRGSEKIRKLGLEWLVRLLYEPKRLWKRYIIGNPFFLYSIFKDKLLKLLRG